jgi:glycerol-3-phosphate dehydrogenase
MKITVVGCGRWGSCIAWYCQAIKKHDVLLYGLKGTRDYVRFVETRKNDYITLPDDIELTDDLEYAMSYSKVVVVSIGAQQFRAFLKDLVNRIEVKDKIFILCMKGLESETGKRLTQIFHEEVGPGNKVAIWVGPGHVQDFYNGRPSCMIIGSDDIEVTKDSIRNCNFLRSNNLCSIRSTNGLFGYGGIRIRQTFERTWHLLHRQRHERQGTFRFPKRKIHQGNCIQSGFWSNRGCQRSIHWIN